MPADLILFGVRSPMIVDIEETCGRAEVRIVAAVSVRGQPRLMDPSALVSLEDLADRHMSAPFLACAFTPARRRELTELAVAQGLEPALSLIDPAATVARSARLGEGGYVNAGAVVAALCFVGEGVLINRNASVGHHSVIGDFVSIGPGATLASNARIGDDVSIGAGAVILPNVTIGAGAVVAAGAVVRKDVPAGMTAAGNPAQLLRAVRLRAGRGGDDE